MADLTKPCVKCGAIDRHERFGHCNPCKKERSRLHYFANPEKYANRPKEPPEKAKEYTARWRAKNPDYKAPVSSHRAEKQKAYVENNKEFYRKYQKEWAENNKEKIAQYAKKYAEKNKEKMLAKWRINKSNRKARKIGVGGKLSAGIKQKLWQIQKGKCACCNQKLTSDAHVDHIMPLALGGKNVDSNTQLLLPKCNMRKNAKHPIDYMRQKGFLL
jgi:5-methylcytosine-specific restriction endonuclease McrA